MTVLVTGAFGNLGAATVAALLDDDEARGGGVRVRALRHGGDGDRAARARARRGRGRAEIVDGDVREPATLVPAVRGADVVVHLAYVIPPACLARPDEARRTNVDGTRNLVAAMRAEAPRARLLFASSLDVFGHTQHLAPPRRADDPVAATDEYTTQKLLCEAMVRDSGLAWSIVRYADVPPIALRSPVPIMFEIPLAQRIEAIHPADAGLATARAATGEAAWGRVWLVGGGASCQLTYGEYLARFMAAMELGPPLPPRAFSTAPYCTDWLDTAESERAFRYQRRSFDDIVADVAALLGWRRPLAKLARPLVRRYMLSLSPYYAREQ